MIDAIAALEGIQPGLPVGEAKNPDPATSFAAWFDKELGQADRMINEANLQVQRFAAGENVPVHHLMLALEEARLAFQVMAQIRNRLLEGYQEVMRMQI
jgi:flagellar hook-basal body complex protein FliE